MMSQVSFNMWRLIAQFSRNALILRQNVVLQSRKLMYVREHRFCTAPIADQNGTDAQSSSTVQLPSALDVKLSTCSGPQELLDVIAGNKLSLTQMVKSIKYLSNWNKEVYEDMDKIFTDQRFNQLCSNIEADVQRLNSHDFMAALKCFLSLGLPSDGYIIKSLETDLMWRMHKLTINTLMFCLSFHRHHVQTEQQRQVIQELIDTIQKRWFDISTCQDLVKVIQMVDLFRDETFAKICDRGLELVGKMNVDELNKVFMTLSEMNKRPTPLLRSIVYHVQQSKEVMPIKQLIGFAYGMKQLNFRDSAFLDRICNDLLPEVFNISKVSVISAFLTSFGHLQYCNNEIFEAFSEWICKNSTKCRSVDYAMYILTLSRLNYLPENDGALECAAATVNQSQMSEQYWLDVVWSLVILNRATNEQIASILNPSFYRLLIAKDGHMSYNNKLKILNINAAAKFEAEGYKGPYLMYEPTLENLSMMTTEGQRFHKLITEAVNNVISYKNGLRTNLSTKMGFHIDAEFVVTDELKPVRNFDDITVIEMKGPKHLQSNQHRIAMFGCMFRDLTLNTQKPIGIKAFSMRLLQRLGYNVIEVPYYEMNEKMSSEQKVKYFVNKIACSISKEDHLIR